MSIKGPAIFLAQFAGDDAPFNNLENISKWASDLGYLGVQIPSWDERLINLKQASESKDYCDEIKGTLKSFNLNLTELSTHLQGQLVAVHPALKSCQNSFMVPSSDQRIEMGHFAPRVAPKRANRKFPV